MFRKGAVKYQPVLPGFQRHGRFLGHLGLQLLHLGGGQVGRVGNDEVQFPLRQALPVVEQVPLHGPRRPLFQRRDGILL